MNKEKLVGLIVKKETYKDTKLVQADIAKKKQEAVIVSISAVHQILKDDYNAEAKLYAVRYLKDCFQKGNQSFILRVEQKILPILVKMAKDSENQNAVLKYGGSYTKASDLQKFKSLITSLFTMSQQCIQKWSDWIPDQNRQFYKAKKEISSLKKNPWKEGFSYFREENQAIFRENCKKNGLQLPMKKIEQKQKNKQSQISNKVAQIKKQQLGETPMAAQAKKQKYFSMGKISGILKNMEEILSKNRKFTAKQIQQNEAKFNAATNQYLQQASEFDENYLQAKIQQFQQLKAAASKVRSDLQIQKQTNIQQTKEISRTKQKEANATFKQITTDKSVNSKSALPLNSEPKLLNQKTQQNSVSLKPKPKVEAPKHVQNFEPPKIVVIPAKNTQKQKSISVKQRSQLNEGYSELKQDEEESQRVKFDSSHQQSINKSKVQEKNLLKGRDISSRQSRPPISKMNNEIPKQNIGSHKATAKFLLEQQFTPVQSYLKSGQQKKGMFILQPENKIAAQQKQLTKVKTINNQIVQKISPLATKTQIQQPNVEIQVLKKKYQKETNQLYNQIQRLEKQMSELRIKQKESRVSQNSSSGLNAKELQFLRQKLERQRKQKEDMGKQMNSLKTELKRLKNIFQKSKQELKNSASNNDMSAVLGSYENQSHKPSSISRVFQKITKIKPVINGQNHETKSEFATSRVKNSVLPVDSPTAVNPYSARIDEDYINNMTHYQKIGSWLDQKNLLRFKQSILGISEDCFYKDEDIKIFKMQNLFCQNQAEFLKMSFSYHFHKVQERVPKTVYKNIPEVDFWTKPITGTHDKYSQETIGRLCLVPLKIMKATVYYDENYGKSVTFLLPFLFYSYLRPSQFDVEEFESVIESRQHQTVKSKVFYLSNYISQTAVDLPNVFKNSILNNQYLEMCLRQEAEERVYMTQIELLRNQKAVIRVLPIPYNSEMVIKAKQLINNLVFLLGS